MRKFALGLGCAAMLGTASTSWAAVGVVFQDDFESYNSTGDYSAVWVGGNGELRTELDYDYDTVIDEVNKTAYHPGGFVDIMSLAGGAIVPTTDEWIRLKVDIFDDNSALDPNSGLNSGNKRLTLGMRAGAGANLIELGKYNTELTVQYYYRAQLFDVANGQTNPNWVPFDLGTEIIDQGDPPVPTEVPINRYQASWHQYIVTVKPNSVLFEFDKGRDGIIEGSIEYDDLITSAAGFDQLRIGGPSNVSNPGGGLFFDNVLLEIIEAQNALEGDLNSDGFVGIEDLNLVLSNWNATVTPGEMTSGDPSGDGFVGIEDLNFVLGNWNAGTPPTAGAAVPEPTTLALLGLGGLAMLKRRR